ncbi:MAG: hypothetical protein WBL19_00140 [Minisyncoccia bacterium]
MPNKNELHAEGRRIIELLEHDFVLPSGALTWEKVLGENSEANLFPDLGDVVAFVEYFDGHRLIEKQIEVYKKSLKNGILVSQFPTLGIMGFAKSYEYSDLLLGLIDNFSINPTETNKKLCVENLEKAIEIFRFDKNISSFYYSTLGWRLPLIDTRDSMFIEIFLDAEKVFDSPRYGEIAENIYEKITSSYFFKRNDLLAAHMPNISGRVVVCKNNTNTLFAWLALYLKTRREDILSSTKRLLSSLESRVLTKNGGVVMNLYDGKLDASANLAASFMLLDFSCDMFKFTGEARALSIAKRIADFWLKHQASTGLFPLKPSSKGSFLDSETDMSVALFKLFELTGDGRYKSAAEKCFLGIWQYHRRDNYPLSVDIESGQTIKNVQRTKFLALFLKLLILLISYDEGKTIYGDKDLWNLLRDR